MAPPLTAFAVESAPNGVPVVRQLRRPRAAADRERTRAAASPPRSGRQVDDAVGACAGNRTEIQDDVFLFAVFMTALAPRAARLHRPDLGDARPAAVRAGRLQQLPRHDDVPDAGQPGRRSASTRRARRRVRVPGNFAFNPYSDFAVHDMGSLGDRIGNAGRQRGGDAADADGAAVGPPLPQPPAARRALRRRRRARSARTTARRRRRATRSTRSARPTSTTSCSSFGRCKRRRRARAGMTRNARAHASVPLRGTAGGRGLRPLASTARGFFHFVVRLGVRARRRCRGRPSSCRASGVTGRAPARRAP